MGCKHGNNQQAQQIDHDDIRICKAEVGKEQADECTETEGSKEDRAVTQGASVFLVLCFFCEEYPCTVIGDDKVIQIGGIGNQTVCQGFLFPEQSAHGIGLADDNTGDIRQTGIFSDLVRNVLPDDGIHPGPELFRKIHIASEPFFIIIGRLCISRRLDKQSDQRSLISFRDIGGSMDDFCV